MAPVPVPEFCGLFESLVFMGVGWKVKEKPAQWLVDELNGEEEEEVAFGVDTSIFMLSMTIADMQKSCA